ncbi:hypothetical protein LTR27_004988 [Elasticomyces elasticus]|nr:hypothetical protein LTR27_004988 [Elasticomyces elasticus]
MSSWGDSAINAFVNLTPSSPWAIQVAEQWRGLPFGKYIYQTPPRRQRSLTGTIDPSKEGIWRKLQLFSSVEISEQSYEQTNSAFFSKLPLDIRMIIYEMVLGYKVIHIESATPQSRIYHLVCNRPSAINEPNHQCHALSTQRPSSAPREDYKEPSGLLPLLATCRRVYSESIRILYAANTFQFTSNHAAFRFLKTMIPSHRAQSIRHFRMIMRLPHHPNMNSRSKRDWLALWEFFTNEMSGLQSLYLKLMMLHDTQEQIRSAADDEGADWVRPMVLMAISANRTRGCRVEIVTNSEVQDLNTTYKQVVASNTTADMDIAIQRTCMEVHQRMRFSLATN